MRSGLGGSVRARAWVENSDIEAECTLECSTRESAGFDVKLSFEVLVGTCMQKLLATDGLQLWLNLNICTDFFQQIGGEVADLVMPSDSKYTFAAGQGKAAVEQLPAGTVRRQTKRFQAIAECNCISKCALMQCKPMLLNGSSREPG